MGDGLRRCVRGKPYQVVSLDSDGERILAIHVQLNPDKLANLH